MDIYIYYCLPYGGGCMNRTKSYTVGLILAVCLTIIAFGLMLEYLHISSGHMQFGLWHRPVVIVTVLTLAMIQLAVQLIFFLHLGQGNDSRWNVGLFCFTFFGILTVVVASIWIMYHLNHNMTPSQIETYINNQSGGF